MKAAEQQGQIAAWQLRECGLDGAAVCRRVRRGRLHPVYRGVYSVGHAGVTREGRFMAAVLACGDRAYLSWFAAGMLCDYLPWEERLPDVTVVGTKARAVRGIRVHRARSLHWRDVTHHHGIPVTAPERTLLDLATVLSPDELRAAARRAQAEHRVNVRQLLECIERSNGHPGTGALRAVVVDGSAPTRSTLENLLLDLLDGAGIERPEINASLRLGGARSSPTSCGARSASRSRPTASAGTSTSSRASTTPASRRSSKPPAGASCASTTSRCESTRSRRLRASAQRSRKLHAATS